MWNGWRFWDKTTTPSGYILDRSIILLKLVREREFMNALATFFVGLYQDAILHLIQNELSGGLDCQNQATLQTWQFKMQTKWKLDPWCV